MFLVIHLWPLKIKSNYTDCMVMVIHYQTCHFSPVSLHLVLFNVDQSSDLFIGIYIDQYKPLWLSFMHVTINMRLLHYATCFQVLWPDLHVYLSLIWWQSTFPISSLCTTKSKSHLRSPNWWSYSILCSPWVFYNTLLGLW